MVQIVPGILATTESEYRQMAGQLDKAGALEGGWVQIDLMDGDFVANKSVSAEVVKKYPLNLQVEVQLMVVDPAGWIEALSGVGVKRFVAPIETDEAGLDEFFSRCKVKDIEVGLSINPETPVEKIEEYLDILDAVLIMSVEPGFGGQEFIDGSIEKVKALARLRGTNGFMIEVDGGITLQHVPELIKAGADNLVIGAGRLLEGDLDENLEQFWEATQQIAS